MRLNTAAAIPRKHTHEGATARQITVEQELRRSVMSCLLWEDSFYESGVSIADRITDNARKASKEFVSALAVEAREDFKLRHVPLLLLCALVEKGGEGVADTVARVIQRPDEMPELLAIYWRDGKKPLAKQLKTGLARAFCKFDEYQLAKYDREGPVKLRDVLFLSHAKPVDDAQADLFKRVADRTLAAPDTWEVGLSSGADKRKTFERLLREGKLGYLALLRNLRGMVESGVDKGLMRGAIIARKGAHRVLPFRYLSAAIACPQMAQHLDQAFLEAVSAQPPLTGETVIVVDTSGSMQAPVSSKSQVSRIDAAACLGAAINGNVQMALFASGLEEVSGWRGLAGVGAIRSRIGHVGHGTDIGLAAKWAFAQNPDRVVIVTDGQSHSRVPDPPKGTKGYMINVAPYQNSVGYGLWTMIDGFSEATLRFIHEAERERA